jgi:hypothetical protein
MVFSSKKQVFTYDKLYVVGSRVNSKNGSKLSHGIIGKSLLNIKILFTRMF